MEYLFAAIILYFLLRTVANLVRLLQGETGTSQEHRGQSRRQSSAPPRWEGPSPRQETGAAQGKPTFWGEDIEDATWHDLADEPETNGPASANSRRYRTRT